MTRIREVASYAGVSVATVSRIMNKSGFVSPELEDRVKKAMAELEYTPNLSARRLRSRKTNTISFINLDPGYLTNPFLAEVAEGIEQTSANYGYSVIVRSLRDEAKSAEEFVKVLDRSISDGAIVAGVLDGTSFVQRIQANLYPFVLVSRRLAYGHTNYVGSDERGGILKIINYLGGLGHKVIGLISGDPRSMVIRDRLQAYIEGLAQWNIPFLPELIIEGGYDPSSGYTAANKLLSLKTAPTAIIAATDRIAFGAWRYIRECGLNVPNDISLVGFDDSECSSLSPVGLTTVRLPKKEIGEKSAEILINQLSSKAPVSLVELILPVELIVRDTCAPPKM